MGGTHSQFSFRIQTAATTSTTFISPNGGGTGSAVSAIVRRAVACSAAALSATGTFHVSCGIEHNVAVSASFHLVDFA